jgi:hypothetical protein
MITRAQAEALLTLADSLEARERLGVKLYAGRSVIFGNENMRVTVDPERYGEIYAMNLRLALNRLIPKQEQSS